MPQPLSHHEATANTLGLKKLFIARLFTTLAILFIFYWVGKPSGQITHFLSQLTILWIILLLVQLVLFRFPNLVISNLLFQLFSDLLLTGLIIYGSGGLNSPFILLLGLIIITAGTQARVLIALLVAVLAAMTYIIAIYTYADLQNHVIGTEQTLKILLQTSLFFLTGGIMALIARRHASLEQQQQQTTTQHQQLQEIHSQVLASMQEGIVILDADLNLQAFNPAASQFLKLPQHQAGLPLEDIITVTGKLKQFITTQNTKTFRGEIYQNNQYLLLTLTHLSEEKSPWLMTIVNITETRQLEQQLARQDKLASMGRMAAMLAHEIRNPMQTIAQAVELMGLNQPNNKLEHIVTDEIARLNRLVSDMLNYASPLQPKHQHIQIKRLIQTAIAQVDLNKEANIQTNIDDIAVHLDPDHFRLVLDNLLRNALRASPKPASVSISFTANKSTWQLCVRDHGIGIDKDIQDKLFQPFQTGHKQGTGLGLATVWQVCQVNQWHVSIDESIDDGACFVVKGSILDSPNGASYG